MREYIEPIKSQLAPLKNQEIFITARVQRFGKTNVRKPNLPHKRAICLEFVKVVDGKNVERKIQHIWIDDISSPLLEGKRIKQGEWYKFKGQVTPYTKKPKYAKINREPSIADLIFCNNYKENNNYVAEYEDYYITNCELL